MVQLWKKARFFRASLVGAGLAFGFTPAMAADILVVPGIDGGYGPHRHSVTRHHGPCYADRDIRAMYAAYHYGYYRHPRPVREVYDPGPVAAGFGYGAPPDVTYVYPADTGYERAGYRPVFGHAYGYGINGTLYNAPIVDPVD